MYSCPSECGWSTGISEVAENVDEDLNAVEDPDVDEDLDEVELQGVEGDDP